jgi:hypothetical protein
VPGGASLGGLGPAVTPRLPTSPHCVFVLERSLPEGLSRADAEAAETRALQREAAGLALRVTEIKVELGLVEETRWHRKSMTLTEEGFQGPARRGLPCRPRHRGTAQHQPRRGPERPAGGDPLVHCDRGVARRTVRGGGPAEAAPGDGPRVEL